MFKQYEELAVLEQGDDGAVISIRGQSAPSVLLGADYLAHLEQLLSKAESELGYGRSNALSLRLLCAEMTTLVATYNETCNKYYGGPSPARSLAVATAELDELRRQLGVT
jgi:hypothetical protein